MCCLTRSSLTVISTRADVSFLFAVSNFSLIVLSFSEYFSSTSRSVQSTCSCWLRTWSSSILATSCKTTRHELEDSLRFGQRAECSVKSMTTTMRMPMKTFPMRSKIATSEESSFQKKAGPMMPVSLQIL